MFRKMRRFKQEISNDECIELLINEKRGVLSVIGDDGYPYGIPLDHYYDKEKNCIYFHGAKEGHKVDAIKANNKVSYCIVEKGKQREGHWSLNVRSVIIFGKATFVTDIEECKKIASDIWWKFGADEKELEEELGNSLSRVMCIRVDIEHMTGKLVNES